MNSGSYQIHLILKRTIRLEIGALGIFSFKPGLYVYTGSAMKNLSQRVQRHSSPNKVRRWHIDYLTTNRNFRIDKIEVFPSNKREECQRNEILNKRKEAVIPIKGFGSSDCNNCISHLVYFAVRPIEL